MLLRRQRRVPCFFCHTPATPAKPSSWRCEACGQLNVRDRAGVIVSDLPAMRDPAMNEDSFGLRAGPSASSLPSGTRAPFCRDCLTNQTLVMNLLSNYLPDESDESYPALEASMPDYIKSLQTRYPPVCAACQPAVDAALARADRRAQAEAWGRALQRGKQVRAGPGVLEVATWQLRGAAWCFDLVAVAAIGLNVWLGLGNMCEGRMVVLYRAISLLWAFWDPTWLRRARGRRAVEGRTMWISAMLLLYLSRLAVATLLSSRPPWLTHYAAADVFITILALTQLRLPEPVKLTLVRPTAPAPAQSDTTTTFSTLTLNNAPNHSQAPLPNPVFGQPSLAPRDTAEPMDWEPIQPPQANGNGANWDAFATGQQRMFARSDETGLEALLAGWALGDSETPKGHEAPVLNASAARKLRALLLVLRLVLFIAILGSRLAHLGLPPLLSRALLVCEGCTSALGAIVALATQAPALGALVLVADAGLRAAALGAPPVGMPWWLDLPLLGEYALELRCVGWAVLDALVLAAC